MKLQSNFSLSCRRFRARLCGFARGDLRPREANWMRSHLSGCAKCDLLLWEETAVLIARGKIPAETSSPAGSPEVAVAPDPHSRAWGTVEDAMERFWNEIRPVFPRATLAGLLQRGFLECLRVPAEGKSPADAGGILPAAFVTLENNSVEPCTVSLFSIRPGGDTLEVGFSFAATQLNALPGVAALVDRESRKVVGAAQVQPSSGPGNFSVTFALPPELQQRWHDLGPERLRDSKSAPVALILRAGDGSPLPLRSSADSSGIPASEQKDISWFKDFWTWVLKDRFMGAPAGWLRVREAWKSWPASSAIMTNLPQGALDRHLSLAAIEKWLRPQCRNAGGSVLVTVQLAQALGWEFAFLTKLVGNRVNGVVLVESEPAVLSLGIVALESGANESQVQLINITTDDNSAREVPKRMIEASGTLLHGRHLLQLFGWAWRPSGLLQLSFHLTWASLVAALLWLFLTPTFYIFWGLFSVGAALGLMALMVIWNFVECRRAARGAAFLRDRLSEHSFAVFACGQQAQPLRGGSFGLTATFGLLRSLWHLRKSGETAPRSALWDLFFAGLANQEHVAFTGRLGPSTRIYSVDGLDRKIPFVASKFSLFCVPNQPEAKKTAAHGPGRTELCGDLEGTILRTAGFRGRILPWACLKIAMAIALSVLFAGALPPLFHSALDASAQAEINKGVYTAGGLLVRTEKYNLYSLPIIVPDNRTWTAEVPAPFHINFKRPEGRQQELILEISAPVDALERDLEAANLQIFPERRVFWRTIRGEPHIKVPLSFLRDKLPRK